jgi:HK97 family phage major capsid protein
VTSSASSGTPPAAATVGTASAGGYLVPEGYQAEIIRTMKDYGAVMDVARVLNTDAGNALPWPTVDDTSQVGALLAENTQVSEQDVTLATKQLDAYKYTSKLVRVSWELLQDSAFNVEDLLRDLLGERVGRILNQHFTTGTGSSQPNGIVTGATSGKTAAGVAAITADELIDLQHSVDRAYRNERTRWMMSDTALASIRKLKDADNQYLWVPGLRDGADDTLLGRPVVVNTDMAVPAAGVKSVLFGDFFAGYVVRLVRGFELIRLDERYADYAQSGFVGFARADGEVVNTAAYKALTQAAS